MKNLQQLPPTTALLPSISVVIPTLARDERLIATLSDLSKQQYPDWDCIVVMQGDAGPQQAMAARQVLGERVRVFYLNEPNASLARNVGLHESTKEVTLFLDDDVIIENTEFLAAHAKHYSDPGCVGVAGQILAMDRYVRTTRHWASNFQRVGWLYFPGNYAYTCAVLNGASANLSVRRGAAVAIGGMDAQYEKGAHREESDFCLRLTAEYGPLTFDPAASLVHIGEPVGGCRAWGMNQGIHPLHHVVGEWYFVLKQFRLRNILFMDLPHHGFALLRRQIFNKPNMRTPRALLAAIRRSLAGFNEARRRLTVPPREIGTLQAVCYHVLSSKP